MLNAADHKNDSKDNVPGTRKILIASISGSHANETGREFTLIAGKDYAAWHCYDYTDAKEFLQLKDFKIDIILVDLSLAEVIYPKEYFLQLKAGAPDIPIVVITERTDYDLKAYVMEHGAADNVSRWQLRNDPDRLKGVIESCISRDRFFRRAMFKGENALEKARVTHDAAIKNIRLKSSASILGLQSENVQLRKDNLQANFDLKFAQEQAETDFVIEHNSHTGEAETGTAKDADNTQALQTAHDENDRLQKDNERLTSELATSQNKGVSDLEEAFIRFEVSLEEAQKKSDAILKCAQAESALDLKKVNDINKALRQYNSYAREWLSGVYAQSPDTEGPVTEQDNKDKLLN